VAVAIEVSNLLVRSLDVDYYEVSWRVPATNQDILDYTFQVLRSEAAMGPFLEISPAMEDTFLFIDNFPRTGHEFRQTHYTVRVTHKPSGSSKDFGPASPGAEADLIAVEIRKHINLLMREFIGRRCWLLPVRTFGTRCSCFNTTLQARTRSHCATCFDTGFVRGYMTPIEVWTSIDPESKSEQNMNVGPTQQSNTTARCGYFPPIKPRDVLIEPDNTRWRVTQVTGPEQVRAKLHHELQLHKIPSTDIEYKFQFDVGDALRNLWLSPARNFTNPQNLENVMADEFPRILQLYGSTYPKVKL
jgi:hypothetical protein